MNDEESAAKDCLSGDLKDHLQKERFDFVDSFLEKAELNHFSMVLAVLQVTKPYASRLMKRKAFLLKARSQFGEHLNLLQGLE